MNKAELSVSEFIYLLNDRISSLQVKVFGEVSELKTSAKGHVYPVIKDKDTGDILPCTIWKSDYLLSGVELEIGLEVAVSGFPEFYGPFGKMSFRTKTIELVGEGQLKKAYDKLKAKLETEGVFDEERKRSLPKFPERVGVITSLRGEVIHDFSNNLRRSGFQVKMLHTPVEGPESGRELTLSVRSLRKENLDVLVIMRGGGSMQSLSGFDNEALVREIVNFPSPVIAGIGHHQDIPLASLAADISASTPSMAASILSKPWEEALGKVEESERIIITGLEKTLEESSNTLKRSFSESKKFIEEMVSSYKRAEEVLLNSLERMVKRINKKESEIAELNIRLSKNMLNSLKRVEEYNIFREKERIRSFFKTSLSRATKDIEGVERVIKLNDPKRNLKLGYGIVYSNGRVIKEKKGLVKGQEINIKISDGEIDSEVKKIK
ncbi:MAG: exodeoxyribonuclease VII large subunit [Candidatus Paceibacterota bacterium]